MIVLTEYFEEKCTHCFKLNYICTNIDLTLIKCEFCDKLMFIKIIENGNINKRN